MPILPIVEAAEPRAKICAVCYTSYWDVRIPKRALDLLLAQTRLRRMATNWS